MNASTQLAKSDPLLGSIIAEAPLSLIESTHDVFFDLVSCIVGQQIHYRRNTPSFTKLLALLPNQEMTPENLLSLSEEAIRPVKLSASKYATLLRFAAFWQQHSGDKIQWLQLSEAEVRNLLLSVKGVGNWSVDMVLMYTLHHADVFPTDDYHLKQIMTKVYHLNPTTRLKKQMKEVAQRWSPYRTVACRHLFQWKELTKQGLV